MSFFTIEIEATGEDYLITSFHGKHRSPDAACRPAKRIEIAAFIEELISEWDDKLRNMKAVHIPARPPGTENIPALTRSYQELQILARICEARLLQIRAERCRDEYGEILRAKSALAFLGARASAKLQGLDYEKLAESI